MAKVIMIQGTMSNVGKSIITGGLCRIFKQDGYSVAPFKSQNMALNSYITEDGLEMGRAQVMQAEAAGIAPDVLMNPILLKPTNDTGSQVIVNGVPIGNMNARDYYQNKKSLIPQIMQAYYTLAQKHDIIVIEGAGSPAEINLKQDDIVNMGMAKLAKAPVLLVGDIDRGGVFAQLLGTINLLDKDEQSLVKGMIINKFRGDKEILRPGLDMLCERANKPVLGVVPYFNLDIDDEDSLTERFNKKTNTGLVDIAVIKLPRISNFTDFNAIECIDGVSLRYVQNTAELGEPDLIILPGTKNTIADLLYIRSNGLEAKIKQHAAKGKPVFGICGGYQMLGKEISDPEGIEQQGSINGIGLLPVKTTFLPEKTRTRVKGMFTDVGGIFSDLCNQHFYGYEIHMGNTELIEGNNISSIDNGKTDGANAGNVYGTYVHGIFDSENVAKTIVSAIMKEKGISTESLNTFDMAEYKQRQYDLLADVVRENIDMEMIYKILTEGV